jgi:hypothetical protein
MAGGSSSVGWLQVGSSATAGTAPGAYVHCDWQGDGIPDVEQGKIEVTTERDDGEHPAPQLGVKSGSIAFDVLIRGKGADQTAGATSDPPADLTAIFDCVFGSAADHNAAVATSTSNAVDSLKFAATTGLAVGDGILIDSDGGAGIRYEAREIASKTDTSAAPNFDFTGAPANAALCHLASNWHLDADNHKHSMLWVDREGEDWRRLCKDGAVSMTLGGDPGGLLRASVSVQLGDWSAEAKANPTYTATTSDPGLLVAGAPFYMAGTAYELISFSLDCGVSYSPRAASSGTNGLNGWLASYAGATLTCQVYHENLTEAYLATLQNASTVDVNMQFGSPTSAATPGSCLYIRMPAGSVESAKLGTYNGVDVVNLTIKACRPTTGSSLRFHLFGDEA